MAGLLLEQKNYVEPVEYFADDLYITKLSDDANDRNILTSSQFSRPQDNLTELFTSTLPLLTKRNINQSHFSKGTYLGNSIYNLDVLTNMEHKYEILVDSYLDAEFYDMNSFKRSENITEDNLSRSDEELFREIYDSFEVPDIKEFDVQSFISNCETVYEMTTEEFLIKFANNDFEGNVDKQLWFHHAKLLRDNGEKLL